MRLHAQLLMQPDGSVHTTTDKGTVMRMLEK